MLGEHCIMASSGSFSFQPWECWHFPDCLLILRIMQNAVVILRNYTFMLSFNTPWMVPNFEWWCFAFPATSCCYLWDTIKNLHSPWPKIPLGCIFQGIYLCAPAVRRSKAGKWKGGSPSSSSGAVGVSWAVPWLCCSETWPVPRFSPCSVWT